MLLVYVEENYAGSAVALDPAENTSWPRGQLNSLGVNDAIRSIEVPAGLSVRVCVNAGMGDPCAVLTADTPSLTALLTDAIPPTVEDFSAAISSLEITVLPTP